MPRARKARNNLITGFGIITQETIVSGLNFDLVGVIETSGSDLT